MKNIRTGVVQIRDGGKFRVACVVDSGVDWVAQFQSLSTKENQLVLPAVFPSFKDTKWTLLQEVVREGKSRRRTWRVDGIPSIACESVIVKSEVIIREWDFDRWLHGLSVSGLNLMERIERARAKGFLFPMRTFFCAERRERGFLRERFSVCEFIKGRELRKEDYLPREHVEKVLEAHKHDLCWGGDCNFGNFMVDERGEMRGIDIYPGRATWRERGQDLMSLADLGYPLPRFYLNCTIERVRRAFKKCLRKLRGKE